MEYKTHLNRKMHVFILAAKSKGEEKADDVTAKSVETQARVLLPVRFPILGREVPKLFRSAGNSHRLQLFPDFPQGLGKFLPG